MVHLDQKLKLFDFTKKQLEKGIKNIIPFIRALTSELGYEMVLKEEIKKPDFYTISDLHFKTKYSKQALRKWAKQGKLPASCMEEGIRFPVKEIDERIGRMKNGGSLLDGNI